MIKREGFPIVAKSAIVDIMWNSVDTESVDFVGGRIAFDNVNQTTAGEVTKERTSLMFDLVDPVPWINTIPQGVLDYWETPADALREILAIVYESDEHQYRLETKIRPEEE
jgi:hypothetical protein